MRTWYLLLGCHGNELLDQVAAVLALAHVHDVCTDLLNDRLALLGSPILGTELDHAGGCVV